MAVDDFDTVDYMNRYLLILSRLGFSSVHKENIVIFLAYNLRCSGIYFIAFIHLTSHRNPILSISHLPNKSRKPRKLRILPQPLQVITTQADPNHDLAIPRLRQQIHEALPRAVREPRPPHSLGPPKAKVDLAAALLGPRAEADVAIRRAAGTNARISALADPRREGAGAVRQGGGIEGGAELCCEGAQGRRGHGVERAAVRRAAHDEAWVRGRERQRAPGIDVARERGLRRTLRVVAGEARAAERLPYEGAEGVVGRDERLWSYGFRSVGFERRERWAGEGEVYPGAFARGRLHLYWLDISIWMIHHTLLFQFRPRDIIVEQGYDVPTVHVANREL